MAKVDEHTGEIFGDWEIMGRYDSKKVICRCTKCGAIKNICWYSIEHGQSKYCSEHKKEELKKDDKVGEWTILGKGKTSGTMLCSCSCGKVKEVYKSRLLEGRSLSCGHVHSKRFIDLTDKVVNDIKVNSYIGYNEWSCTCTKCNSTFNKSGVSIRNGTCMCPNCGEKAFIDLTDQDFGDWHVIKYLGNRLWECECSCGKVSSVSSFMLRNGTSTSCGHSTTALKDMTDQVIGQLKVMYRTQGRNWMCKCSCGKEKEISGYALRKAQKENIDISCGCNLKSRILASRLNNYGEVCATKKDNPRTVEQIEIVSGKENFETYLRSFTGKPTAKMLSVLLNINETNILQKVHKFGLEAFVQIYDNQSYEEKEVLKYVQEFTDNVQCLNRTVIKPYELDIYVPHKKFAIEYNGSYWHSEVHKDKMYHQNKSRESLLAGIRLLQIFEYEWMNPRKQNILKGIIKDSLVADTNKVYARDTYIKEVSNSDIKEFLNLYHLQGYANASICVGLFQEEELLGLMTFGAPRFDCNYQYEIIRLCYKNGLTVVGGTQKMYKYFLDKYTPDSIITYSDFSKFTGKVYSTLGMKYIGVTKPGYLWVDIRSNETLTRYQTTKQKLTEKNIGVIGDTEDEIMHSLGYVKIYNSGNLKFEYRRESTDNG